MITRFALPAFVFSCLCIAGAYALAFLPGGAPPWASWGMALGGPGALATIMLLGASRGGRIPAMAAVAIVLTFVLLVLALGTALLLPPAEGPGGALLLGLPLRTAVVIYGVGIAPLFFLPVAYAAAFDAGTLTDADLERVRAAAAERVA